MSDRLADRIALAIVEHGPTTGSRLAIVVAARKDAVLRELRSNPVFESLGRGRGSRWRLSGNRIAPPWEPLGTEPREQVGVDVAATLSDRLAWLERRVAVLERQWLDAEAPTQ